MKSLIPTGIIPDKPCPKCGGALRVITKVKNPYSEYTERPQFVGCTQYPRCNYVNIVTPEVAEAMVKQAQAFEALPAEF